MAFIECQVRKELCKAFASYTSFALKERLVFALSIASNRALLTELDCTAFIPFLKTVVAQISEDEHTRLFTALMTLVSFAMYDENKKAILDSGVLDVVYPLIMHPVPYIVISIGFFLLNIAMHESERHGNTYSPGLALVTSGLFARLVPSFTAFTAAGPSVFAPSPYPINPAKPITTRCEAFKPLIFLIFQLLTNNDPGAQAVVQGRLAESGLFPVLCAMLQQHASFPLLNSDAFVRQEPPPTLTPAERTVVINLTNIMQLFQSITDCTRVPAGTVYTDADGAVINLAQGNLSANVWDVFAAKGIAPVVQILQIYTRTMRRGVDLEAINLFLCGAALFGEFFRSGIVNRPTNTPTAANRYTKAAVESGAEDALLAIVAEIMRALPLVLPRTRGMLAQTVVQLAQTVDRLHLCLLQDVRVADVEKAAKDGADSSEGETEGAKARALLKRYGAVLRLLELLYHRSGTDGHGQQQIAVEDVVRVAEQTSEGLPWAD